MENPSADSAANMGVPRRVLTPWRNFFNPSSPLLFTYGSDVDWVNASYAANVPRPLDAAVNYPWFQPYASSARSMIRENRELAAAILGALFSWRVLTVEQLRAGLCQADAPVFTRDEPSIYSSLSRLGAVNIGFSPRERLEHTRIPHVWLSVGNDAALVKQCLRVMDAPAWMRMVLSSGMLRSIHQHARHNTFAAHLGLTLANCENIKWVAGDGWGSFNLVDGQARGDAGVSVAASMDAVAVTGGGLALGVEIQHSVASVDAKIRHWVRLLAHSPLQRRGLVNVWILTPDKTGSGGYMNIQRIMDAVRLDMPETDAGEPPVARRICWARWEDWFADGYPTERFGLATDMTGAPIDLMDGGWDALCPDVRGVDAVRDWGWSAADLEMRRVYGLDLRGFKHPDMLRGGFYGFTTADDLRRRRPWAECGAPVPVGWHVGETVPEGMIVEPEAAMAAKPPVPVGFLSEAHGGDDDDDGDDGGGLEAGR